MALQLFNPFEKGNLVFLFFFRSKYIKSQVQLLIIGTTVNCQSKKSKSWLNDCSLCDRLLVKLSPTETLSFACCFKMKLE